jgi:hypothetical protein
MLYPPISSARFGLGAQGCAACSDRKVNYLAFDMSGKNSWQAIRYAVSEYQKAISSIAFISKRFHVSP